MTLSPSDRLRLILRAFHDCNQPVTYQAVSKQYHYETGEHLTISEFKHYLGKHGAGVKSLTAISMPQGSLPASRPATKAPEGAVPSRHKAERRSRWPR